MKNVKGVLVVILISVACSANAQFKIGAAAGVNVSKFSTDEETISKNVLGYNIGLITEFKLPIKLGVEADFLYSVKGASLTLEDLAEEIETTEYALSYIDIPVVAKWYMLKVTNLQLGVQYSHLIGAELDSEDVKNQFMSGDFSVVVGAGVDVSKFHFSARYNLGVVNVADGGDFKNNMLTFSAGLWLKK